MSVELREIYSNELISLVMEVALESQVEVFLVGGGLRDILLGREMEDLDFVVNGEVGKFADTFARRIEGKWFWLDEPRFQARVVKVCDNSNLTFDFALQRGPDIATDLSLRDFTINAMALPLVDGESTIVDPFTGVADLRAGIIRTSSEASFDDDPLRLVRAVRLAATLGFSIEQRTSVAMCARAHLLQRVAPERIRDELFRILRISCAGKHLGILCDSRLLMQMIPGPDTVRFEERIKDVVDLERVLSNFRTNLPQGVEKLEEYFQREVESGVTLASVMKLSVLIPSSSAEKAARGLKLGNRAERLLKVLCDPLFFPWEQGGTRTERALYRFFADHEPAGIAVLMISLAKNQVAGEHVATLLHYFFTDYQATPQENLVSGDEVMGILGIGPGKTVGEAMESLKRAERVGMVNSKAQAVEFLTKKLLTKNEGVI